MDFDQRILVTGGAGFIGSAVVRKLVSDTAAQVANVDVLTYAGNPDSLSAVADSDRYRFYRVDICDSQALDEIFAEFRPTAVMHLAAESHVDRSIDGGVINFVFGHNMLQQRTHVCRPRRSRGVKPRETYPQFPTN